MVVSSSPCCHAVKKQPSRTCSHPYTLSVGTGQRAVMLSGWKGEPLAWRTVLAAAARGALVYMTNATAKGLSAYETGDQHWPIQFSLVSDYRTPLLSTGHMQHSCKDRCKPFEHVIKNFADVVSSEALAFHLFVVVHLTLTYFTVVKFVPLGRLV